MIVFVLFRHSGGFGIWDSFKQVSQSFRVVNLSPLLPFLGQWTVGGAQLLSKVLFNCWGAVFLSILSDSHGSY